jgi:hypothetical protein
MEIKSKIVLYSILAVFGILVGLYEYPINQTYGLVFDAFGCVFMLAWSQAFRKYIKP